MNDRFTEALDEPAPFLRFGPRPDRTTNEGWQEFRRTRDLFVPVKKIPLAEYRLMSPPKRSLVRLTSQQRLETACATDMSRSDSPAGQPDPATMASLVCVQRQLMDLLTAGGPETMVSTDVSVRVAHYFADLRAVAAMVFRSWPVARAYASTCCLASALDAEHAVRVAQAQPLLNTPGKKKTSRPYTAPPVDCPPAGAALEVAAKLLDARNFGDARSRLAPLVERLRETDLALSTWLRRPSWISAPLRRAVMDLPRGRGVVA